MDILMLSAAEVEHLLDLDALLDGLALGFQALSQGTIVAPQRNEVTTPNGYLLAMPAWQEALPLSVKIVSVFHENSRFGLPGHQAVICLFDQETGTPVAVMDGTYITAIRTAGAAAVATQLLARKEAHVLTILGAGVQGASHLKLFPRLRDFSDIRIASLYFSDAQRLAASHPQARSLASFEEAVRGADVICLCSTSSTPILHLDWLAPGAHVTSIGYMPPGGELERTIIEHGRLFVETRLAFEPPPAGCDELAGFDPHLATELGEVLLGYRPGRQTSHEVTVYKAMGHAMEDMVAAYLVYQQAQQQGIGQIVRL
ncbi:MAG: ornithine cyclodeaminase family protein [Chloroflexi bacterium]|nr:ornithine cyclodeaminase family protein [Chloroflexota bacterium]